MRVIPAALLRYGSQTSVFAPYKRLILAHRVVTPETTQSARSRLHLALELIEKAPVGVPGNELLRVGLDQSGFRHAQCIEAERVLGIIVAPNVVPDLAQRLQRIIVARCEPLIDQQLRHARGLGGAQISGFQYGAQDAFGRDWVIAREFSPGGEQAAIVL